ncbi:acyl-CoA synthetase (NDP forming) [Bradyrhizobium sp. LB14.3]|uniref:CoA-binding protein n=1 Tax=Bradyrhizobium sp. LB14.3 TaxID=3156328 RepID=UPI0033979BBF
MHSVARPWGRTRTANHKMSLRCLFEPKGLAVIGASPKPSLAKTILGNVVSFGFDGNIAAVNPSYTMVDDVNCYRSVSDVPFQVDLAVLCVRAENILPLLEECKRNSVPAVQIISSGFAELDTEEGRIRQQELRRWAEDSATTIVIGPNTFGVINLHRSLVAVGDSKIARVAPGGVSGVLQSGQMVSVMHPLMRRGVGISKIATTGNEVSVTTAELISFFADDPQTEIIISYCEGIKDPKRFTLACTRAQEKGKPIIMLHVGAHPEVRKAISRHTATEAANSYEWEIDLLRDLRVITVDSAEDLIETVVAFQVCRKPRGNRLAFASFSGGMGNIVADLILSTPGLKLVSFSSQLRERLGEVLPKFANCVNPLDLSAQAAFDSEALSRCTQVLGESGEIDLLLWGRDLPTSIEDDSPLGRSLKALMVKHPEVVVIPVSQMNGLCHDDQIDRGPPTFAGGALLQGTAVSVRAVGRAIEWHASG